MSEQTETPDGDATDRYGRDVERVIAAIEDFTNVLIFMRTEGEDGMSDRYRSARKQLAAALHGDPVWLDADGFCEHGKLGGQGCEWCRQ